MRWIVPRLPRAVVYGPWNPWGLQRELPPMPRDSFRELIKLEPPFHSPVRVRQLADVSADRTADVAADIVADGKAVVAEANVADGKKESQ